MPQNPQYPIAVFYDGLCPICVRQVENFVRKDKFGRLNFINAAGKDFKAEEYGLDPVELLKSMHAMDKQGNIVKGVEAFIWIWKACGYWFLPLFASLPFIKPLAKIFYRLFSRYRYVLSGRANPAVCDLHCGKKEF